MIDRRWFAAFEQFRQELAETRRFEDNTADRATTVIFDGFAADIVGMYGWQQPANDNKWQP
jgi:hypothetical protein